MVSASRRTENYQWGVWEGEFELNNLRTKLIWKCKLAHDANFMHFNAFPLIFHSNVQTVYVKMSNVDKIFHKFEFLTVYQMNLMIPTPSFALNFLKFQTLKIFFVNFNEILNPYDFCHIFELQNWIFNWNLFKILIFHSREPTFTSITRSGDSEKRKGSRLNTST